MDARRHAVGQRRACAALRRGGRVRIAALAAAVFVALVGCERSATDSAGRSGAAEYNLLLITLDTTRADRIGCYGHKQGITPSLDALAASGVRFANAFAQVPITLPSHATILTGVYPPEHGVRENGQRSLAAEVPTLAEVFREQGYRTGAFIAATALDSRYGLDRGFELYDDTMVTDDRGRERSQRQADVVCDSALDWLESVRDERFLAWVHFYDPHLPYEAPAQYVLRWGDPYDAEVAFMDANVGRLLAWVDQRGLGANTLVVAVADHGEAIGEHGYTEHALLLYDSIMRVPLIISLPGVLPGGRTVDGVARTVDLVPTILDLLGMETPAVVSGESLVATLRGAPLPDRVSYGETEYPHGAFGWAPLRCLVEKSWKYIRAPEVELYDLAADRGELNNIAPAHPDLIVHMEEVLTDLEAGMTLREGEAAPLDDETRQALESLGYVGSRQLTVDPQDLKNPVDMVDVEAGFWRAMGMVQRRQLPQAIALLEPAHSRSPESFVIVELLGKAYALSGRLDEAEQKLAEAVRMQPHMPGTLEAFAEVLAARGKREQALTMCERALRVDPDNEKAQALLKKLQPGTPQRP